MYGKCLKVNWSVHAMKKKTCIQIEKHACDQN